MVKFEITISGFIKKEIFELRSISSKESIILLITNITVKFDEVGMVSSSGQTLANIFRCYYQSNWLKVSQKDFTPIDHKFLCFVNKLEHEQFFLEYIS